MSDNNRPKWMDGPGEGEGVDYELVRDWALVDSLDRWDYVEPFELRTLCRELLRVKEKLQQLESRQ